MVPELGGQVGGVVVRKSNILVVRRCGFVGQVSGLGGAIDGWDGIPRSFTRVCGWIKVGPRTRRGSESGKHLLEKVVVGSGFKVGAVNLVLHLRALNRRLLLMLLLLEILKRDLGRWV